ncbi:MAG: glycosyltransferase family 39 protein [Thermoanaerobaculales bacterium]|nr:glycosyltransferase family 39 protein [Thermoanaerobaculales bacterium]
MVTPSSAVAPTFNEQEIPPVTRIVGSDRRLFWISVFGWTVLHVALAMLTPISGDEAYYWDCARHFDWAYFDQPGGVIWPIAIFRLLFGDTALAVRAPAITFSFLTAIFVLGLVRRLGGTHRHAAAAYALLHGMPFFFLGSFYESTDIGLTTAFAAATWAAVSIAQGERRAWWGFGLATGLGFLAKFPAVLVVPAIIPALGRREIRRQLTTPTPWLAAALSFTLTAPVWIWAVQHDWANISFQLEDRHKSGALSLKYLGEFLGVNLLLATPFLAVALVIALWILARRAGADGWAVIVATIIPFLFFGLISLHGRVGPHWGGPALVTGAVVLALTPFRGRRVLVILGMVFGLSLCFGVAAAVTYPKALMDLEWSYGGRPKRINTGQLARILGNEEITAELALRLRPEETLLLTSYSDAHLYALVSRGTLQTRLAHLAEGKHGLASLYWYEENDLLGQTALVATEKERILQVLPQYCTTLEVLPPITVSLKTEIIRTVYLYRCVGITRDEGAFSR